MKRKAILIQKRGGAMKQLILILSVLSVLLFGVWGCPENTEKPKQSTKETVGAAESLEKKATDTTETTQAGLLDTEAAKEKAEKVFEELKVTSQGQTEETKGSE